MLLEMESSRSLTMPGTPSMLKTAPRAAAGAKANITAPTKEAVVSKMENTSFNLSSLYTKKPTNRL